MLSRSNALRALADGRQLQMLGDDGEWCDVAETHVLYHLAGRVAIDLRVAPPAVGQMVYFPALLLGEKLWTCRPWKGDTLDLMLLERGIVHTTAEPAAAQARAMLKHCVNLRVE